jgi:HSP20 family protein
MALPVRRREATAQRPMQRWEPFRELEDLHQQMDQLMESVWSGTGTGNGGIWSPPVDIEETDDAWIIEAELPGAKQDDVNVEVRDSELTITGEIKERERTGVLRRRTRRVGQFEYRVTLPSQTDTENVEATLDGGVLTVRIPKPEQARARRIDVKAQ